MQHLACTFSLALPLFSLDSSQPNSLQPYVTKECGRRKKKLEISQPIDRNKVLTLRSNPFDEANTITFVTSGVNHIRGWALKGDQLKGHSWTGECQLLFRFTSFSFHLCRMQHVCCFFCMRCDDITFINWDVDQVTLRAKEFCRLYLPFVFRRKIASSSILGSDYGAHVQKV